MIAFFFLIVFHFFFYTQHIFFIILKKKKKKKKKLLFSSFLFIFRFVPCGKETRVFSSLFIVPEKIKNKKNFWPSRHNQSYGDFVELIGVKPDLPLPHLRNCPPVQPSSPTNLTPDRHVPAAAPNCSLANRLTTKPPPSPCLSCSDLNRMRLSLLADSLSWVENRSRFNMIQMDVLGLLHACKVSSLVVMH
jgi:hypothetical protein